MIAGKLNHLSTIGKNSGHLNRHVSFRIDRNEYNKVKRVKIYDSNRELQYDSGGDDSSENTLSIQYHYYHELTETKTAKGTNQNECSGYLIRSGSEKKYYIPKGMDLEEYMRVGLIDELKALMMYYTSDNNNQENDCVENTENFDKNKKQGTGFLFKEDQVRMALQSILKEKYLRIYSVMSKRKIVICVPGNELALPKTIGGSWKKDKLVSVWPIMEMVVVISVENETEPYVLTAYPRRVVRGPHTKSSQFMNPDESMNSLDIDEEAVNEIYCRALNQAESMFVRYCQELGV